MDLVSHLTQSLWIPELEYALEKFSFRTYLDWFDQHRFELQIEISEDPESDFPKEFLNYLEGKVSNPCS